jgi:hypothetical protein
VYVDDDNLLDENYILQIKTQKYFIFRMEVGEEVNADKTKCMFMSRDQDAGRIQNIKNNNIFFERT